MSLSLACYSGPRIGYCSEQLTTIVMTTRMLTTLAINNYRSILNLVLPLAALSVLPSGQGQRKSPNGCAAEKFLFRAGHDKTLFG